MYSLNADKPLLIVTFIGQKLLDSVHGFPVAIMENYFRTSLLFWYN